MTDYISIWRSRDIWINHVELCRGRDGLIDITKTSTRVTVSHCHLHDHHKAMLLGASNEHAEASDSRLQKLRLLLGLGKVLMGYRLFKG